MVARGFLVTVSSAKRTKIRVIPILRDVAAVLYGIPEAEDSSERNRRHWLQYHVEERMSKFSGLEGDILWRSAWKLVKMREGSRALTAIITRNRQFINM